MKLTRVAVAVILLAYLVLAGLFAIFTPPWQAPDEPAHYNYVRYLAEHGDFPVLHPGDYPHEYLEAIKAAKFPAGMPIAPIRYEFHQPPLYYALLAPVSALAQGNLIILRLVSVLLGAGIPLLAYAIGRRVFPGRPGLAVAAAALAAFLPQHLATVSQVGNDVLAELLLAAVFLALVRWVQEAGVRGPRAGDGNQEAGDGKQAPCVGSRRPLWALGLLVGLTLITKTTAYISVPLVGGALVWRWWRERAALGRIVREGAAVVLPTALIALPWFGRNLWVYGWSDFLGLQRHDAIVLGQMRAAEYIAQNGWAAYWRRAVEWTFKSFWGVFGWMSVWLDTRVYLALAMLSGIAAGGLVLRPAACASDSQAPAAIPGRADGLPDAAAGAHCAARLLVFSALLTFLTYAWYNTQFLQHQGRYLLTALVPIALAFAAGWDRAVSPGAGRWLAAGLALAAVGVAVWGVAAGAGLPKWPAAMLAAAAVGAGAVDLALSTLARRDPAGLACRVLRGAALAFPYAFLVLVALYALFGEIVWQLR